MKKKPHIGEYRWIDEFGTGRGLMVYTDSGWVTLVGRERVIPKKIPAISNRISRIKA